MDFSAGSMRAYESNLGFCDRMLGSLTSEMAENRARMLTQGGAEPLLPGRGTLKRSQSGSEVEVEMDSRDESVEQSKQARVCSRGGSGLLIRRDHARLSCTPSTSDDALLTDHSPPVIAGQARMLSPSHLSAPTSHHLSYQRQDPYLHKTSDMLIAEMAMARQGLNLYDASTERRYPFTPAQWAELQHQALIYKYIIHGYPVPNDLVLSVRKGVAALSGLSYGLSAGWGSFNVGAGCSVDAEPGRCRRTDGKKWRCSRTVVQEQKYCERHMHRGRHRSKKAAEAKANSLSQPAPMPTTSCTLTSSATTHSINLKPAMIVNSSQQRQQVSTLATKTFVNAPTSASATAMSVNRSCISARLPSSQSQLISPQSPTSSMSTSKDPRLLSELGRQSSDLQPDHPWPAQLSKMPSFIQQKQSSNPFNAYDSPVRSLQGREVAMLMEVSPFNAFMDQRQQQQPDYFSSRNSSIDAAVEVKSENQPLRHFFGDWPRSGADSSPLSWSDAEEENPSRNASSTQLSISILPTVADLASANASPAGSKNVLSPLRLSMSRDRGGSDHMHVVGLGMALGSNTNSPHQSLWSPMSMENSMGGPLAEALQSSSRLCERKTGGEGLSLLSDGGRQNKSSPQESSRLPSPTGVLQKAFGNCFSDSGSRASSPASGKPEAVTCEQNLKPHLNNGSSHFAT